MKRLVAALRIDILNQWRNRLYAIGVGVGALGAVLLAWLAPMSRMAEAAPAVCLAVVGGSTLMYVGAMILFERDERTLTANSVTPLQTHEYLIAKVLSLTLLSTLESVVMLGGALVGRAFWGGVPMPNVLLFLIGVAALGVVYVLAGVILVVRFRSLNEFLMPMAGVAVVLQLPIFYFIHLTSSPLLLCIPTSPTAMLIRGGFAPLTTGQLLYAAGYSVVIIAVLAWWANVAFRTHRSRMAG